MAGSQVDLQDLPKLYATRMVGNMSHDDIVTWSIFTIAVCQALNVLIHCPDVAARLKAFAARRRASRPPVERSGAPSA
jgi:hypothetical protein